MEKRKILFRGKRITNGEWVYGYYRRVNDSIHCIYEENSDNPIQIEKETIGQFTELKDKNGLEIYEGDIVQYKWRSSGKWDLEEGSVNYKAPEWFVGDDRFVDDGDEQVIEVKDHEIIGNIHEHPHLLNINQTTIN